MRIEYDWSDSPDSLSRTLFSLCTCGWESHEYNRSGRQDSIAEWESHEAHETVPSDEHGTPCGHDFQWFSSTYRICVLCGSRRL